MSFLNSERLTAYTRLFVVLYLLIGGYWILGGFVTGHGTLDKLGKPIGSDFVQFWTASRLALDGSPGAVYEPNRFYAAQQKVTNVFYPLPWHYPPLFLLLVLPLALLPYLLSLLIWLTVTLGGYLKVLRIIAPHRLTPWLALAFPGTFQNLIHGQTGFLSAGLLGGGLALMDRRPVQGGILLGLLAYKPHLAVLVPVALMAGHYWKSLAAMIGTAGALVLMSEMAFGNTLWLAFLKNIPFATTLLINGSLPLFKMPTVFAGTLLVGGGATAATFFQAAVALGATASVVWVWHRRAPIFVRASTLSLGVLMSTPHAFEYDLTILALPLAWLSWNWGLRSWTRLEELIIILVWLSPLIISPVAKFTSVQFGPILFGALLIITLRRFVTAKDWSSSDLVDTPES